jgi:DeoR/GlpR family transcriptional regulator of sugar metabolism
MTEDSSRGSRRTRQQERQAAITEAVVAEGSIRIERLAEMFETSVMTVHRDLDELEAHGLLRKSRGIASATSTILVESSDVYRLGHQAAEKNAIAAAAAELVEPGQAIVLDDSTTVLRMAPYLEAREPLTVITNVLSVINELRGVRGITMIGIGGQYYNWCSAFMGPMTTQALGGLHADTAFLSTSAITNDVAYHQFMETIETKRAMLACVNRRVLLVDHTKFERQALHALAPLTDFDTVIVDDRIEPAHVDRMRDKGIEVIVVATNRAPRRRGGRGRGTT